MTPGPTARLAGLAAAAAGGVVLGTGIAAVSALRQDRPMHAVGRTYHAVVRWSGTGEPSGVPWLDAPRERPALVRFSRGAGLPAWAPDVQGVAVRVVEDDGGRTDVLLSSTGLRGAARYGLVPRRSPFSGPSSTLMPFRGPRGPLVLAVQPAAASARPLPAGSSGRRDAATALPGSSWTLLWSGTTGPWRPFAVLDVLTDAGSDTDRGTRFHPIGASPPGLPSYRWAAALRAPAYRAARLLGRPAG
ncbi:hypothetical protein [uncultured Cellulomonas sp.]|uniref:hypothetical protein n=1 Tax=uncultured Cellulomonas sp. TaxID=189682 RepID=UPI0026164F85|nr:hypothetical protein [uncultured Cellulomonas sp.]